MADSRSIQKGDVDKVLAEARVQELSASATAIGAEAIPDFCGIYKSKVRPIVMVVIGFLKVINKQWAEALAAIVAFVDKVCP